jgi:hypothetical protein
MIATSRPEGAGKRIWLAGLVLVLGMLLCAAPRPPRGAFTASPEAAASPGPDFDRRLRVAKMHIAIKRCIVLDLLDGRTTLLQAASQFRLLDPKAPACSFAPPELVQRQCSPEELHCRAVIRWVQAVLGARDPGLSERVASQYEEELDRLLQRGVLRLPDEVPCGN